MTVQSSAAQRKHAAILERLSNRVPKPTVTTSNFESVDSFLQRFSETKKTLEGKIHLCLNDHKHDKLSSGGLNARKDLDDISTDISDLEKLIAENSYFLPSYEVRTALKNISDLKESLENVTAVIIPRKKFTFRKTLNEKKHRNPAPEKATDDNLRVELRNSSEEIRNLEGSTVVKDFRGDEGDFSLNDLSNCKIYIRGKCRALFIHRLKKCEVYTGPVLSSVRIEDVENCVLMLASHQIRIHNAKLTDFYIRVRSRPIIEDSSGVRFAPYLLKYEGIVQDLEDSGLKEETGNWENVDDFRWLRAVKSPNWCVLPEKDRSHLVDISGIGNSGI